MSNSASFDPEIIARMFPGAQLERKSRNCPPRRYYLIICEGEESETNYFEALQLRLPPDMIHRIYIKGPGTNTLTLLKQAEDEYEKRYKSGEPPYYKIWLVFDHDSFPHDDFDNTIKATESRTIPHKCYWHCAWSNEAFELWYLLHFHNHFAGMSRTAFRNKLESELKAHGVNRKYEKNAKDMYNLLEPLQEQAITHAKIMLRNQYSKNIPPSRMNPATTVHLLVEELISYIPSVPKSGDPGRK